MTLGRSVFPNNKTRFTDMKKLLMTVAVAAAAVAADAATTVTFSSPTWRDVGFGGGEFGAALDGAPSPNFYTFCLEKNEAIQLGTPYGYTSGNAAVGGGIGGGSPDPISEGTAWLFTRFGQGTLANYSFDVSSVAARLLRAAAAVRLQNAIWSLEDEQGPDLGNVFVAAVVAQFGSFAAAQADYAGNGVVVLNPAVASSGVQSVLRLATPVPDNGASLGLLGLGLAALGVVRRIRS